MSKKKVLLRNNNSYFVKTLISTVLLIQGSILLRNSRRYFWQNINLVLLQEKSLKITVLTLVSSENAAYGASPITSVPNIKSTANFTKATGLVVYQLLMLPMTPVQKTTQMLTKSSNCNRK